METDALLPYGEVSRRLRIRGQRYAGVKPIRVDRIIGSVDRRNADFDRKFRPARRELRDRMRRLREVFAFGEMPPIDVYEVGGMYFVVDGHHRVAIAREAGAEFIDAQVTSVRMSHRLERRRRLPAARSTPSSTASSRSAASCSCGIRRPRSSSRARRGTASCSRSSARTPTGSATSAASWCRWPMPPPTGTRPSTCRRSRRSGPPICPTTTGTRPHGDMFLWVHGMRRELRTTNRDATWADAALSARREGVPRSEQKALQRERRSPLPIEPEA